MDFAIGLPQIAALLILIQRGAEEIHSARNTKALLARGGLSARYWNRQSGGFLVTDDEQDAAE